MATQSVERDQDSVIESVRDTHQPTFFGEKAMSNRKKRADKTDWKQVALSMHDKPENLYEKLAAILNLAHQMVEYVDKKHPEPIKKALDWHKSMSIVPVNDRIGLDHQKNELKGDAPGLSVHYVKLHRLDMDYDDSLIAESYFGVLGLLAHIQDRTNFVARYSHECRKSRVNTIEFIERILCHDTQVPHSFLNEVLPLFFSLQVHCCNLVYIANRPPGSIADPRKARNRSVIAGTAKNYGEHVLRDMVIDFLNDQNPPRKYRGVPGLFEKLEDALVIVLNDYLAKVGKPIEKGGMLLRYGEDIKDPYDFDLERKLKQWKREVPEFKKCLERICIAR